MLGIGAGLAKETSSLMLGQYFKRRREFVEALVQSGSGLGITIFSVFFHEVIELVLHSLTSILYYFIPSV
jgi:hypothetical protein